MPHNFIVLLELLLVCMEVRVYPEKIPLFFEFIRRHRDS